MIVNANIIASVIDIVFLAVAVNFPELLIPLLFIVEPFPVPDA
jgi:hypothetical protein